MTPLDELNKKIELAEADERVASNTAALARERLHDLYRERSFALFGVRPGVIVTVSRHSGLRKTPATYDYVVERVDKEPTSDKPWIYGRKIRRDGTPGERVICLLTGWRVKK